MRMDHNYFQMLSGAIQKAAQALSNDRKEIKADLEAIIRRYILEEVEEQTTDEKGVTKTVKQQISKVNSLDNILPRLYSLASRSNHLRTVSPQVFNDMIRVQAYLRVIERARQREDHPHLYQHQEAVLFDFLQGVIHQLLQIIVPGVARDITLPVIPLMPPEKEKPKMGLPEPDW